MGDCSPGVQPYSSLLLLRLVERVSPNVAHHCFTDSTDPAMPLNRLSKLVESSIVSASKTAYLDLQKVSLFHIPR